ncbi:pyocin [Pseudomonas lundensis]|nr:S-type pyocin domain-containing protein [Pseudomonas lundensis]NNA05956.1 pyocin [Pseudomonas lundensis]
MASTKGLPQVQRKSRGDAWHSHTYYEDMDSTELKAYQERINNYNAMLERQSVHMEKRLADLTAQQNRLQTERKGCVFAKCSKLPDQVINYNEPNGFVPVDRLDDYGNWGILGAREVDSSGLVPLKKISGSVPAGVGSLALRGVASRAASSAAVGGGTTLGLSTILGFVAMLWPSDIADGALYTEDQLRSLTKARTRLRLHIEPQADGSLKGYGFHTGKNPEWEMIDVVQFNQRGSQQVADFGGGVELIWTPAVDPKDTLGIPALQGAPQAPKIWIYPPTPMADSIIVDPIYPPDYKDFILVFPADSGVPPLYIVFSLRDKPGVVTGSGQDATGIWLSSANNDLGSPIPSRIADQLRGKRFNSFDDFRKAFWITVGNDAELKAQFNNSNKARMLDGLAPRAPYVNTVGKRRSFELHHKHPIAEGGEVYDVDNLCAMTPKKHIDSHRK